MVKTSLLLTTFVITMLAFYSRGPEAENPFVGEPADSMVISLGEGGYTYVLTSNRQVYRGAMPERSEFRDGYAVVSDQGFYSVIDSSGRTLFSVKDTPNHGVSLSYANEEMFCISYGFMMGFLNRKGELAVPVIYGGSGGALPVFSEGVCCVMDSSGSNYSFIDKNGNQAIDFTIKGSLGGAATIYFPEFHDGLCVAHVDYKFGYIDHQGHWAIPPMYDQAERFGEGLAAVRMKGRVIFIDTEGKQAISRSFGAIDEGCCGFIYGCFKNGEATVNIDTSQMEIDPLQLESERDYGKDRFAIIDKNGKIINLYPH